MNSLHDIIDGFRRAMADAGIEYHGDLIADGELHRFTPEGDRAGSDNGWYVLYGTPPGGGKFGSWKLNIEHTYTHRSDTPLTPEQRDAIRIQAEQTKKQRDADKAKKHAEAQKRAQDIWDAAKPVTTHPYTDRKQIEPMGARVGYWPGHPNPDALILPAVSGRTIHSLQAIFPDGTKQFLPGGAIKGMYMKIQSDGDSTSTVVICEGYATGVSIYKATGYPVVAAFFASNLLPVAQKIRGFLPDSTIIIAADNDQWTDGNPGVTEANRAAEAIGARVVIPQFTNLQPDERPTDFNDMRSMYGGIAVSEVFNPQPVIQHHTQPAETIDILPTIFRVNYDSPLTLTNSKGKPKTTIENLSEILDRLGVNIRYNVISKEIDIIIPGARYSIDNNYNACLSWIKSECVKFDYSTANLAEYLIELADRNQYNPVAIWIDSRPWDRVDRLKQLTASLDSSNPTLSTILLTKWMTGAVHAAYSPGGIGNSSILVLQGEQYAGKTAWFWSLLGDMQHLGKEGAILNPQDKDSVLGVIKYWLVELGELDATFRRSDISHLKGFITKSHDEIRRPYAASFSNYPRRTMLFGSVNPKYYLHDETGNRRFWTIECGKHLNPHHGVDMQQAWAQIKNMYDAGHSWKLTREEMAALNEHNEAYQSPDPIGDLILKHYDPTPDIARTEKLTAADVLVSIGYDRPTPAQARSCAAILRKHFGDSRPNNGRLVFIMPQRREMF